ncbi:MAG: hypothetical protein NC400_14710 [Clostridium sp.]|nr:hypothetical protein [Clostridium sp.]
MTDKKIAASRKNCGWLRKKGMWQAEKEEIWQVEKEENVTGCKRRAYLQSRNNQYN